ncbi:unnamed protein product (macronuclear) [Paramecium tetraurelia]|uniref:Casein kinase I n=1 Tax=Paramecium tetraurelia TaxID=5888 RepID=A0BP77_PARTE|nr:uncharacterized protein GSPATT00005093001 [Paramecium tetraurelia]CAK60344.1 unnamed protein product [Paramecium tetraurelia]|eukprot:XP_001427742.1 hypothetical protein (macronuclear) [Paramecium tetraurelia strain d4-2]
MQQEKGRVYYGRFVQKEKLSQGSFGVVYICHDKVTRDYVAIKVEKENCDVMSLEREIQIIEELRGIVGKSLLLILGVPKLLWYGNEYNSNCMAMQLLGKDLSYFLKRYKKLSLKTICNLAEQLLTIIEEVHKRGVIHRDIKPENILMGRGTDSQQVYLVDYGISKKYRNNGQHIPFQENKPFMGTTRYASISAHKGYELSRRDDLESLGYVFIYLLKGNLPWQNITSSSDREKTRLVGKLKMELEMKELCKGLPNEFQRYMDYVQKLKFAASPDYKYLFSLLQKMAQQNGINFDRKFDWNDNQTSSTKSSDQAQQSFNDIDVSNLQGDYLKVPDIKKSEKRKSFQTIEQYSSQQSSVVLNYVPSVVSKINSRLKDSHYQRSRQNSKKSLSRESSLIRQPLGQRLQGQIFFNGEFRDLEDREKSNHDVVKNQLQNKPNKVSNFDDFDDFDDQLNDDIGIQNNLKKVGVIQVHFKEHLSKQ